MELIDGVEFITVDKRAGLAARRDLRARLRGRRFDVLLHMQLSLRASLISSAVPATIRLGFDRARARELQWLFTNARIAPRAREHVLDSFFGFLEALGIHDRTPRWDVTLPPAALEYARTLIPDARPTLVVSPCSSHLRRNWRPEAYAAVVDHAVRRCLGAAGLVRHVLEAEHELVVVRLRTGTNGDDVVSSRTAADVLDPMLLVGANKAKSARP